MVDPIRFGEIVKSLEDMFGDRTPGQQKVLYEKFKYTNAELFRGAIEYLTDNAKKFPTPGEIKAAIRETYAKKCKEGQGEFKIRGCANCHDGYVLYSKDGIPYVGDCAYCHSGEMSIQPQVIQKDGRVYYACEKVGEDHYRANAAMTELYAEAKYIPR
jgi:hypothetical protein